MVVRLPIIRISILRMRRLSTGLSRIAAEKEQIARYAASLIVDNDFVYIDAGTTTAVMIDYITAKNVVFVTNSLTNAKRISDRGYTVYILGGEFKSTTELLSEMRPL